MSKRGLAFVLVPWLLWCGMSSRADSRAPPEQLTPPSKGVTPPSKGATQTSKGVTAPSKGVTAPSKGVTAPSKGVTRTSKGVTQTSKGVTQTSKGVTQTSQRVTPLPKPRNPPTTTVTQKKVFAPMLRHVQTIQNTNFGHLPTVAPRLQEIAGFARNLQKITTGSKIPSLYSDALISDAGELGNVAHTVSAKALGVGEQTRLMQAFDDVHSDLSAKARFAEQNPSQPFASVNVTVITRNKDGKEVSNYEVWYCLKGLVNYKDRYDHFDQLSSPTSNPLPPGNYTIWTRKGSIDGPLMPAKDVGSDGRRERSIDLPTP